MSNPLVSIIIPVYNSEKYLDETIKSAIDQTWKNKEVIVVDDGSTDNSLAIALRYKNDFLRVFSQKNNGASAARNFGLKESTGDYIQFLDADDLLSPNKIEAQLEVLNNSNEHLALCTTVSFKQGESHLSIPEKHFWYKSGSADPFDFLTKLYGPEKNLKDYMGMITVHSWLTPRKVIQQAGFWNESLTLDDDGEFFCRVVLCSKGIKYSDDALAYYRHAVNGENLSSQNSLVAYKSLIKSTDLKCSHLKNSNPNIPIDKIMARHYWSIGVNSYPKHKTISANCIKKATAMGYDEARYLGGGRGKIISYFFGWRMAKVLSNWIHSIKLKT